MHWIRPAHANAHAARAGADGAGGCPVGARRSSRDAREHGSGPRIRHRRLLLAGGMNLLSRSSAASGLTTVRDGRERVRQAKLAALSLRPSP